MAEIPLVLCTGRLIGIAFACVIFGKPHRISAMEIPYIPNLIKY